MIPEGITVPDGARDWHDYQWPVTLGCMRVSEGCRNCTAEEITARASNLQRYAVLKDGRPRWTGIVEPRPGALGAPARWPPTPCNVFVASNSDLFHPAIDDDYIDAVFDVVGGMGAWRFGFLTKHADRMRDHFAHRFIPQNAWLGVTVEAPDYLHRLDDLMTLNHAVVRWVSCEPLLASVTLVDYLAPTRLNWVTAGPETGEFCRPCHPDWMRRLRDESAAAGVPFFTQYLIDGGAHRNYPAPDVSAAGAAPSIG